MKHMFSCWSTACRTTIRLDRLSETADDRGLEILEALSDWATEIAP